MTTQQDDSFQQRQNLPDEIEQLSERECIEIIREHGTEDMKKTLESILEGNKWKVKKTNIWERIGRGRLPVRTLYEMKGSGIFDC